MPAPAGHSGCTRRRVRREALIYSALPAAQGRAAKISGYEPQIL
nr:F159 [uncultured bacterium]